MIISGKVEKNDAVIFRRRLLSLRLLYSMEDKGATGRFLEGKVRKNRAERMSRAYDEKRGKTQGRGIGESDDGGGESLPAPL